MKQAFQEEFVTLANLVKAAKIPDETGRTLLWCLEQLPSLYDQLCETYETRFSEKIVRLEQGMLGELAKGHPDARGLGEDIQGRLRALHERHGLPSLDPKPPRKGR